MYKYLLLTSSTGEPLNLSIPEILVVKGQEDGCSLVFIRGIKAPFRVLEKEEEIMEELKAYEDYLMETRT